MKDEEIARLRLLRQHLTGTPLPTPEAVVGWLGAVQAQEFGVAKWSIARRCRGRLTSADLDRALADGRILRTHALRSTWHFVLPVDLRWLLMLVGPRVRARMASYYWRNGLTESVFQRSQAVLREALAGGRQLVRKDVAAAFARGRVPTDGLKLRFLSCRRSSTWSCAAAPCAPSNRPLRWWTTSCLRRIPSRRMRRWRS